MKWINQVAFCITMLAICIFIGWTQRIQNPSNNEEKMGNDVLPKILNIFICLVLGMTTLNTFIINIPAPEIYEAEGNVHQNDEIAAIAKFEIKPLFNWHCLFDIYYTLDGTDPETSDSAMLYDANRGLELSEGEGGFITAKAKFLLFWSESTKESKRIFDPNKSEHYIDLKSITITREDEMYLKIGETQTVEVIPFPSNASEKKFSWESNNPSVADIKGSDAIAIVAARSVGTAKITVSSVYDRSVRKEFIIHVVENDEPTKQPENNQKEESREPDMTITDSQSTAPSENTKVTGISIKTKPSKSLYFVGDTLDTTGLTLIISYDNGSQESITSGFICTPTILNTSGTRKIQVIYGDYSTNFEITVNTVELVSIAVKTNPTRTEYIKGDVLDTTGLSLTATYNNQKTEIISTGFSCSPTELNTVGSQTIFIKYGNKSASFIVQVIEPTNDQSPCGDNLFWKLTNSGELVISGSGAMCDYSSKAAPWYKFRHSIVTVSLPNGMTSIGSCAFEDFTELKTISLPNGIVSIGANAFSNCTSLSSISIPSSVTTLGNGAFQCSGLTKVVMPNSVKNIGLFTLNACTNLNEVILSNSITSLPESTFFDCTSLRKVSLPDSITIIGEKAFYNCSSLSSISIPEKVSKIETYAFAGCSGISSFTIPENVETISGCAFHSCTNLQSIYINNPECMIDSLVYTLGVAGATTVHGYSNSTAQAYAEANGYAFVALDEEHYSSPADSGTCGDNLTWAYIDGTLIISGSGAMYDYEYGTYPWANYRLSITSVSLPNGLTRIGNSAFNSCENLTNVSIPSSVMSIGDYAFVNCYSLDLSLPSGISSIGRNAFASTGLRKLILPNGLTSISQCAFMYCENLSTVSIASSITSIESGAFFYCTNLTSITIPKGVSSIAGQAFEGCSNLVDLYIMNPDCKIAASGGAPKALGDSKTTNIHGYEGSTSQDYAETYGYTFCKLN